MDGGARPDTEGFRVDGKGGSRSNANEHRKDAIERANNQIEQ